ncbi:MAG TPA: Fur family transcriptional regulator [Longilinea sp.]|nr:Fur family transcriptional regulator [Longilinea sp.]
MPDQTTTWFSALERSGYRLTKPRRIVTEIISTSHYSLTPSDLFLDARKKCPNLGLVTVYRTLEKLEMLGLVQRVHQPCGCHAYIAAAQGHEHLLLCTTCGKAEFFSGDQLQPLFDTVAQKCSFTIQDHWLQLFGTCKDCQSKG